MSPGAVTPGSGPIGVRSYPGGGGCETAGSGSGVPGGCDTEEGTGMGTVPGLTGTGDTAEGTGSSVPTGAVTPPPPAPRNVTLPRSPRGTRRQEGDGSIGAAPCFHGIDNQLNPRLAANYPALSPSPLPHGKRGRMVTVARCGGGDGGGGIGTVLLGGCRGTWRSEVSPGICRAIPTAFRMGGGGECLAGFSSVPMSPALPCHHALASFAYGLSLGSHQ